MTRTLAILLASAGLLASAVTAASVEPTVSTADGQVSSVTADGATAFKGIPYAQPPIGAVCATRAMYFDSGAASASSTTKNNTTMNQGWPLIYRSSARISATTK